MQVHRIRKGLDLPISGQPEPTIHAAPVPGAVALLGADYVGMKPKMHVQVGDVVRRGQVLFEDKKIPGVRHTAPGAGDVVAINRGERRVLLSVVVRLNDSEQAGEPAETDYLPFAAYAGKDPAGLSGDEIKALLLESGLWTAFRTRPYSKVADPATVAHAIFINGMDTEPLAPHVDIVLEGQEEAFEKGLCCVAKLTEGPKYLCRAPGSKVSAGGFSGIDLEEFSGPHPAGTVGLHIHVLSPVSRDKVVWHLDYQDVIAIGRLFMTGRLDTGRVIALAGPSVTQPRLLRTRAGASTDALTAGQLAGGEHRVISGSVLCGRTAMGEVTGYLGRYHRQIAAISEGRERVLLGWMRPGLDTYSVLNLFLSRVVPRRRFAFTTSTKGSPRAIVPVGAYEKVMPMDLHPTFLLRALAVNDVERAEELGCLELDEEDLALCSFVCPGKQDHGANLRTVLTELEKEG